MDSNAPHAVGAVETRPSLEQDAIAILIALCGLDKAIVIPNVVKRSEKINVCGAGSLLSLDGRGGWAGTDRGDR